MWLNQKVRQHNTIRLLTNDSREISKYLKLRDCDSLTQVQTKQTSKQNHLVPQTRKSKNVKLEIYLCPCCLKVGAVSRDRLGDLSLTGPMFWPKNSPSRKQWTQKLSGQINYPVTEKSPNGSAPAPSTVTRITGNWNFSYTQLLPPHYISRFNYRLSGQWGPVATAPRRET